MSTWSDANNPPKIDRVVVDVDTETSGPLGLSGIDRPPDSSPPTFHQNRKRLMADTPGSPVFTIGHSNHPPEKFLATLERHAVN